MSATRRDPPRRPKGHQPHYFDDPAIDQLHSALLALATELSVAFDRIDTLEQILEQRAGVARAEIDAYVPDDAAVARRAARRHDIAERLLRPFVDYRANLIERAAHATAASAEPGRDGT
jgi:hypothetical protein